MTMPESVPALNSSAENERNEVIGIQETLRRLANKHRKLLPRQILVGHEDPYEGDEGIESYPKGIFFVPEGSELVRIVYSEEPIDSYDPTTGVQTIENRHTAVTHLSARDDHWLRYGPNAIQWINRIVEDKTREQKND